MGGRMDKKGRGEFEALWCLWVGIHVAPTGWDSMGHTAPPGHDSCLIEPELNLKYIIEEQAKWHRKKAVSQIQNVGPSTEQMTQLPQQINRMKNEKMLQNKRALSSFIASNPKQ